MIYINASLITILCRTDPVINKNFILNNYFIQNITSKFSNGSSRDSNFEDIRVVMF